MATTELTERDVTKKMLEDAADDMSAVMKFEDAIPTGKKTVKAAIQADVIEAAGELRTEDVLRPKTVEVLTALGVELPAGDQGEESKANAVTEIATGPDEPEGGESVEPPATETKKITRIQAVCKILQDSAGISREDLAVESDSLYAANGGKVNKKESEWATKTVLGILIFADAIIISADKKYSLT